MTPTPPEWRAEFEAWFVECDEGHPKWLETLVDGSYDSVITRGMWDAFCAARRLAGTASAWRPIESAPRDGTELLLCDDECIRSVGRWSKHNHVPLYGWVRQVELYGEEVDAFDAKFWQPLPPPPEAA